MKKILFPLVVIILLFGSCKKTENTPSSSNPILISGVNIGSQIWSNKNLDVDHYRNGDPIPQVSDPTQWENLTIGAWCWYNNDSATYAATYGRLYNWYAVSDSRGLAPQGWHVPTVSEWNKMTKFLDSSVDTASVQNNLGTTIGSALKSTSSWFNDSNGNNSSGFSAVPGGSRYYSGIVLSFYGNSYVGSWWCATANDPLTAWEFGLTYLGNYVERSRNCYKTSGNSVRLVKD